MLANVFLPIPTLLLNFQSSRFQHAHLTTTSSNTHYSNYHTLTHKLFPSDLRMHTTVVKAMRIIKDIRDIRGTRLINAIFTRRLPGYQVYLRYKGDKGYSGYVRTFVHEGSRFDKEICNQEVVVVVQQYLQG